MSHLLGHLIHMQLSKRPCLRQGIIGEESDLGMASKDRNRQKLRWPFSGSPTIKGNSIESVGSLQLCHAKTFLSSTGQSSDAQESKNPSSQRNRNTGRQFGKGFRRQSPRKSQLEAKDQIVEDIEPEPHATPKSIKNHDDEESTAKEIKRSMTMPEKRSCERQIQRQHETSDRSVKINNYHTERSTLILEQAGEDRSTAIEAIPSFPAYELVPKTKSQSMPVLSTPKITPRSPWTRSFRFRNGGRRRGSFMIKKQVLPRTDEESSLTTEEMVGFECIETTSAGNRSALQRKYTSESKRSLSSKSKQQIERRQSTSQREYGHELRESHRGSDSLSPSIGPKSYASRVSKATQHRSVSSKATSQRTGTLNRFMSTFTTSSKCGSSAYDDGNDMSAYWTEATSRRTGAYSKASYYSSYSRSSSESSSDSSGSSSYEDKEDCEDEDDDCSISSNSTLSTRASLSSRVWDATVVFSESLIDAGREAD